MTTITRHPTTTHHTIHLPREAPRRVVSAVAVVTGALLVTMTITANLFNVGPSFESLMGDFRPHLTNSAIATSRTDLSGLAAAGTEMNTKLMPALATQLGMTPAQLSTFISQNYPQVSAGLQQLPQITTTFNGLVATLDAQRPLFRSADAIPTQDIPATTMPWAIAVLGVVMMAGGAALWFRPRVFSAALVGLGVVMIAVPLVLTLPQKASDSDQLNANLKPVYTQSLVTQSKAALTTVSDMGTQLNAMLPALGAQLNMTPAQLQQFLGQNFPATAAALTNLPAAMPRFQNLVGTFDSNLGNYNTLKPVLFAPIIWAVMGAGLVLVVAGGAMLRWPRHQVVTLTS